jgi:hypothetical protein
MLRRNWAIGFRNVKVAKGFEGRCPIGEAKFLAWLTGQQLKLGFFKYS